MSVYNSDIGIRVQTLYASCDSCRKQALDPFSVPSSIVAKRIGGNEHIGMAQGPLYAIDGMPSVAEAEVSLMKQGWTIKQIGETRFLFCPNCKEKP